MIWFESVKQARTLVHRTPAILWHVRRGWCYQVWEYPAAGRERIIGVFYVTLLCGHGGVLHFDSCVPDIAPASTLAAFRKGLRIVRPHLPLILATIPAARIKLLSCVQRLGFVSLDHFVTAGTEYCLLKYLHPGTGIVKANTQQEVSR